MKEFIKSQIILQEANIYVLKRREFLNICKIVSVYTILKLGYCLSKITQNIKIVLSECLITSKRITKKKTHKM